MIIFFEGERRDRKKREEYLPQSSLTSSGSHLRLLVPLLTNDFQRCTNDGSLDLLHLPGLLLGDLLCESLLVKSAVCLCPCNLAWVLPVQEQALGLAVHKGEGLVMRVRIRKREE